MKTELKAKFLQHILNKKKNEEGFTLIELLVVIIIIGILSAIALPSFLNQANKAKQSEAKTITGSMNRAQQAFYLENNAFVGPGVAEFGKLGLGVKTQTENYKYTIANAASGATKSGVTNQAAPTLGATAPLRSYIGGVTIGVQAATSEATTIAILCEADKARINGGSDIKETTYAAAGPTCPTTFSPLK